jgi:hypothetical protein
MKSATALCLAAIILNALPLLLLAGIVLVTRRKKR